ncbi:hypothetical protein IAE16_04730 [Hydrogenobacter sp. T-2]|uniref:type IV pilus modification PilV family protein n=1 Tax=Pampinifervens diazotrophicum TaxID=1632018 RepID=UPI002B262034|nr:hypothetical protein [Hydrogenobacter sp. T-2]WPM32988.1 hypothetical protein IAE16_04730 [Hydrogenobacter sp. T-2]
MRGFSLVEGLVAVLITFIIAVGIAGLLTMFGVYNRSNVEITCVVQAVSSTIEACRGGVVRTAYNCGGRNINVNLSGNCNPPQNTCSNITASANVSGISYSLTDVVCNLP